jgi:tetratricopeptide (TPR) repeat protein
MLMHVANAQRMKKNYQRAIDLYEMIRQYFPDHELAFESAYWRLFCYYQLDDRRVADMADAFLKQYGAANKDHEFIGTARLMIADYHFTKQNFKLAAEAYAAIDMKKVPDRFRGSTLFHKGWCEAEAGKHGDAIISFNGFIKDNPSDPELPKALAKRGLSLKETQNPTGALQDFDRIIKEFPQSDAMELALYLSGVIHYEQRNWKPMISSFEALMQKFSSSAAQAEAAYKTGLGYIELKDTAKALPMFRKAVKLDEKTFGNVGTQKVLLCLWSQKDVDALAKEVDDYRGKYSDAVLVPRMLGFLGLTFFDKKDFHRASRYLTWAATPDTPENTEAPIWNYLGQALLEIRSYDEALKAIDNYLNVAPEGQAKAKGFHIKAKSLLGLGKYDEANETAAQGLHIVKDGGLQGQLLIAQGDALLAQGDQKEAEGNHDGAAKDWKEAAGKYVVPSQMLDDNVVTPEALYKAAQALERLHDKAAEDMSLQLKTKFPNFKPEEPPPPPPAPKKEAAPVPEAPKEKAPPKAEKVE